MIVPALRESILRFSTECATYIGPLTFVEIIVWISDILRLWKAFGAPMARPALGFVSGCPYIKPWTSLIMGDLGFERTLLMRMSMPPSSLTDESTAASTSS